jgi:hypothetical protein
MDYRVGVNYSKTNLNLRGNQLDAFGITFGLGFPLRSVAIRGSRSMVNIGCEIGRRGTTENGLIREDYVNIYFGISIYETWFFKRRYN